MIKNIDINKLCPHPDNPRKELGDLSELAESIRVQGILQNLTAVLREPGYCISCKLWNGGFGKCTEGHDMNERPPCSKWESDGSYTVIIGHRRLAAAKMAGLTEVPCAIVNMTPQEQIATMLLENMQRSDLTVYEQAQGIQMMLDLGESVASISEKTGFSESTVRRRVKLLELDQEKFKASAGRNVTLREYEELSKIKDIELRNKVLEHIGTQNFNYELQKAIDNERKLEWLSEARQKLNRFATEVKECPKNCGYISSYCVRDEIKNPEDADERKYFYQVTEYGYVFLYAELAKVEEDAAEMKRRERQEARRNVLREVSQRTYRLRSNFVKSISNTKAKENINIIIKYLITTMLNGYSHIDIDDLADVLDISLSEDDDVALEEIIQRVSEQPEKYMLLATYCLLDDNRENYYNWDCSYSENPDLDRVYDFLEALGYEMSDEEKAMRNGTHELFTE